MEQKFKSLLKKTRILAAKIIEFLSYYSFEPDPDIELAKINFVFDKHQNLLNDNKKDRLAIKSLCQYRCQQLSRNKFVFILSNFLCLLFAPFFIFLVRKNNTDKQECEITEYAKIDYSIAYQIPDTIRDKTKEIIPSVRYIYLADLIFVLRLFVKNRIFFPELFVKYLLWIAKVRPIINQFRPRYLVCFCESSSLSSLRTLYCNSNKVKTVNITHGEEFLSVRNAFSTFDVYYRWKITPQALHKSMYMEANEAYTFCPSINIKIRKRKNKSFTVGFLWPSSDVGDVIEYAREIRKVAENHSVIVRPHPRDLYRGRYDDISKEFNFKTSESKDVSVDEFLNNCDLVVGYTSALLVQANFSGVETVYVRDKYLIDLQKYHPYYQNVSSLPLCFLGKVNLSKFKLKKIT